jgi:ribosome-binding factor A
MARDYPRRYRVADQIQRELGGLVRRVRDPRVAGLITISGVDVSPDLGHAKVFVTVLECDAPADAVAGLNSAAGFLRRQLGQRLRLRGVPELVFHYDTTLDQAERIEAVLQRLRPHDGED